MDYKNIIKIFIGILIIFFILYNLNLKVLVDVISEIDLRWILVAGILGFIAHMGVIYRLKYVLDKFHKIPTKKIFWSHFFGYIIGLLTPGKLGYLSIAYLFKKEKVPVSLSSSVLIFNQVITLSIQAILASLCLVYLLLIKSVDMKGITYLVMALGWIFFLSSGILLFFKFGASKLKFIKRLPYGEKIFKFLNSMDRDFSKVKSLIPTVFIITLSMWIIAGLAWSAIGMSLGMGLPILSYILLNPLISSLTFIPISPSGIGFAEAGSVLIFSLLGVQAEKGFILMVIDRSINLIISLLGLRILFFKK